MIVGTAGHIDHGKTTLIKALTGVDADRLPEEKARGITLDLGYAYHTLPSGQRLGFVDVPGHEKLVHNMLAGATGIDFALLIVAADDGVMPQTREHLQIIDLLQLRHGAAIITKIDRVDVQRRAQVREQVHALLQTSSLREAPIISACAPSGLGLAELTQLLEVAATQPRAVSSEQAFRLAIDRCFSLSGSGTIVTGTVFAGEVSVDDELLLSPSGISVRVRAIHSQNQRAQRAGCGERCGINIVGRDLARENIKRGDWLLRPNLHAPTQRLDVSVRLLAQEGRPLRDCASVHLHLACAHTVARLVCLEGNSIEPGQTALAQLILPQPIGALVGDRLVLRDASAARTVGGGIVLDPLAPARKRRSAERLSRLRAAALATPQQRALALLSGAAVDLTQFQRSNNWFPRELALDAEATRVTTADADYLFARRQWQALEENIERLLAQFHQTQPDERGLELGRLARMLNIELPRSVLTRCLQGLQDQQRVTKSGAWLHLPQHRLTLADSERALAQRVLPLLREQPFDPPWVRDIAKVLQVDEMRLRLLLLRLARLGEVFQVVRDLFYAADAVKQLAQIAKQLEARGGRLSAAEFRDALGIGRKRSIQLLEFFDRIGYTRRTGDTHRIRAGDMFD